MNLPQTCASELCDAAVRLARDANYVNAGRWSFWSMPTSDELYFIEVNPRIQVEHTVTEIVTGIDIVRARSWLRRATSCTSRR